MGLSGQLTEKLKDDCGVSDAGEDRPRIEEEKRGHEQWHV